MKGGREEGKAKQGASSSPPRTLALRSLIAPAPAQEAGAIISWSEGKPEAQRLNAPPKSHSKDGKAYHSTQGPGERGQRPPIQGTWL